MLEALEILTRRTDHTFSVFHGGSGDTLVYIHGLFGVASDDQVLLSLTEDFEVFAPLHPGFRNLAELDEIWDIHELAFHYEDILEALGLRRISLIGHSYGGMVAAELAAHSPSRVTRLMLVSPLGLWRDEEPAPDIFRAYPRRLDSLLWSDQSNTLGTTSGVLDARPEAPDLEAVLAMAQGMASIGKFMWPLPDKGLERRLHRIRASTSVVWGSDDRLVPRTYAEAFVSGIPNAELRVVDGGSHMVPSEREADFIRIVKEVFGS